MNDSTVFNDDDVFFDKKLGEFDTDSPLAAAPEEVVPTEVRYADSASTADTAANNAAYNTANSGVDNYAAANSEAHDPADNADANTAGDASASDSSTASSQETAPSDDKTAEEASKADVSCSETSSAQIEMVLSAVKNISDKTDSFSGQISNISAELSSVKAQVTRLAAYDTAVETLKRSLAANQTSETNLYKEVEKYKKGTYFTNIKPFLMFMIELLCDLKKTKAEYTDDSEAFIKENSESVYNDICLMLDYYIENVEKQLGIQGVTIYSYECGSAYVSRYQQIAKAVPTDDPELNGTVAKIYCDCYMYEDKVLKPARVHVYKLS